MQDHPRGCGENLLKHPKTEKALGSPPRMRGKRDPVEQENQRERITPADAGKTAKGKRGKGAAQDHPRGCGENVYRVSVTLNVPGSPPRMRGKQASTNAAGKVVGITPADAGKTYDLRKNVAKFEDHPRGCGENAGFHA